MGVRQVAIVPVLALTLAGCSGEPQAAPKPLPTVEPTVSPTPVALQVPESAKPATTVGAAAFARFYLQVMHEAVITGDMTQFDALSDPTCSFCTDVSRTAKQLTAAGNTFTGGGYTVLSAEATQDRPNADALVDVLFDRAAGEQRAADGSVVMRSPAKSRGFLQIQTRRKGEGWITKGLRFPAVPK